jgi:hypothetical protein
MRFLYWKLVSVTSRVSYSRRRCQDCFLVFPWKTHRICCVTHYIFPTGLAAHHLRTMCSSGNVARFPSSQPVQKPLYPVRAHLQNPSFPTKWCYHFATFRLFESASSPCVYHTRLRTCCFTHPPIPCSSRWGQLQFTHPLTPCSSG